MVIFSSKNVKDSSSQSQEAQTVGHNIRALIDRLQPLTQGKELTNRQAWELYANFSDVKKDIENMGDDGFILLQEYNYEHVYQLVKEEIIPNMIQHLLWERKEKERAFREWLPNTVINRLTTVLETADTPIHFPIDFGTNNAELEKALNDFLAEEVQHAFSDCMDAILESIWEIVNEKNYIILWDHLSKMKENTLISENMETTIKQCALQHIFSKTSKALLERMNSLYDQLDEARVERNIFVDIWEKEGVQTQISWLQEQIAWGSAAEEFLQQLSNDFENVFIKKLYDICLVVLEENIANSIKNVTDEQEFQNFENADELKEWKQKITFLQDDKKNELVQRYESLKRGVLAMILSKLPRILVKGDDVFFWNEKVAINKSDQSVKKQLWKLEPILNESDKDSIVATFQNRRNKKDIIKPSLSKQLRVQGGQEIQYVYTKKEWQEMMTWQKTLLKDPEFIKLRSERDILKKQLDQALSYKKTFQNSYSGSENNIIIDTTEKRITQLKEKRNKYNLKIINKQNPLFSIQDILNRFPEKQFWEVPSLGDNIVITHQVIEDLQALARLCRRQILKQDGIITLEWEGGVGKNVLIDIYAHYTNRKVFTFPCNNSATKEDLTYQWLINENGTYKLHSKVYEAALTPGAILLFDEINTLPTGVVKLLNGLFDFRRRLTLPYDNEYVKAQEDLLIIGTQNPTHYLWTAPKPQDTISRETTYVVNYPKLKIMQPDWTDVIAYDEALMLYRNSPLYYKFLTIKWHSQEKVNHIKYLIEKKRSYHFLTEEQEKQIADIKNDKLSDPEFVQIWNKVLNESDEEAAKELYGEDAVEGIKDIYTLLQFADHIRNRYIEKMTWINKLEKISNSVSPRDLNKMMSELEEGKTAKEAFMRVYLPSVQDNATRNALKIDLESKSF